jgi:hypothetical protein
MRWKLPQTKEKRRLQPMIKVMLLVRQIEIRLSRMPSLLKVQQEFHFFVGDIVPNNNKKIIVDTNDNILGSSKSLEDSIVDSILKKIKERIEKKVRPLKKDAAAILTSFEQLKAYI